jgi:hypothetical protein
LIIEGNSLEQAVKAAMPPTRRDITRRVFFLIMFRKTHPFLLAWPPKSGKRVPQSEKSTAPPVGLSMILSSSAVDNH